MVALLESLKRAGRISTSRELCHLLPRPMDWGESGPRLVTGLEVFPWNRN
jgi:hypothetical protein